METGVRSGFGVRIIPYKPYRRTHQCICRASKPAPRPQKVDNDCPPVHRATLLRQGLLTAFTALAQPANGEQAFAQSSSGLAEPTYGEFLQQIEEGLVSKVDFYRNETVAIVELLDPNSDGEVQYIRLDLPRPISTKLVAKLKEKKIDFTVHSTTEEGKSMVVGMLVGAMAFPLVMFGSLLFLSSRSPKRGSKNAFNFLKSTAPVYEEPDVSITFNDVAGVGAAKEELMELVEFLKEPQRFTAVGASIPKGVLLVGPPGTGKTLMAKAIAGEAGVPFIPISGSEFVEIFVGVGASRVRDMFNDAKKNTPCLIFIDEIDAVGRSRSGPRNGSDEQEQTLNQLLTEMDGFEGNPGIIVIAATNRADILDPALLRPGRFDRQVTVDVPDVRGRMEILQVHARNKILDEGVDLEEIALRTPGFAGADLANLLNEAAILSARRALASISKKEVDDSIDRLVAGMEGLPLTDGRSKSLVAYHEVGHAVCGTLTKGHDAVQKVTLMPRGQAQGLTWFVPGDDPTLVSKQQIFARIVGALGGRAAEEVIFGREEVTTGAASDLQQVTQLAKHMVLHYGMSAVGPWAVSDPSAQPPTLLSHLMSSRSHSEQLQCKIDDAVRTIATEAYDIAVRHIQENREAIDAVVEVLLEKETLTGDEFRSILRRYTEMSS